MSFGAKLRGYIERQRRWRRAELAKDVGVIVCTHVLNGDPVMLAVRDREGWQFLCGKEHPNGSDDYGLAGFGELVKRHPDVEQVLDLLAGQEAERRSVGSAWARRPKAE